MKKTSILLAIVLVFCTGTGFAAEESRSSGPVLKKEQDLKQRIVRIRDFEGVAPLNLFIEPGTVVIWLNQYHGDVRITFPGKKVTLACTSPVNFTVNDQGLYVSSPVAYGAVASLCFIERGKFDYFIERSPAESRTKRSQFRFDGKIVVK